MVCDLERLGVRLGACDGVTLAVKLTVTEKLALAGRTPSKSTHGA